MFQHLEALRGAPHIMRRQLLLILLWLLSSSSCSSLLHIIDWCNVSALKTRGHHHRTRHITSLPSSLPGHNHADDAQKDWARYSLHLSYKKAGGILYKQSILTPAEFTTLQMAIDQMNLKLTDEKESSFATNRIGAVIGKESDVHRILSCSEGSLCRLVSGLADNDDGSHEEELGKMILSPDIPIEIRIYEKKGAGMEWHVDDIIYQNTKQIEVVFTLENSSDCCTMWRPHDQPILATTRTMSSTAAKSSSEEDDSIITTSKNTSKHDDCIISNKYRVKSVQTTPNSAILIKAGGVEHKVSALTYGRRVILKMAFVREGALMSDEMREHVSHHRGSSSAGNKRKKKRVDGGKRHGGSVEVERKQKRRRR